MTYSGPWRVVNSLTTLRLQLNAAFPGRSHASDGTIADDVHTTTSDHYPHVYAALGPTPVVTAFDGTQDPAHGCDNAVITEAIRVSRDPRVKYVIWDHRMFSSYASSGYPAWTWRPYTGSDDPHTNHFHISVLPTALADSTAPWAIGVDSMATMTQDDWDNLVWRVWAALISPEFDANGVAHVQGGPAKGQAAWHPTQVKAQGEAIVKLGEQLTELSQQVAEIAAALKAGVEVNAKVELSPAGVQQVEDASFRGAQRSERE